MKVDPLILLTIAGMAIVTYATRAGGIWLMSRLTPSERIESALRTVPGAVLISIVVPAVAEQGLPEIFATFVTGVIAWQTKNPLIAMVVGVTAIIMFRWLV